MYKILFYHANTLCFSTLKNSLFLSTAAIYFKTHIDINYPNLAQTLEWHTPIQKQISDEELIDYCNKHQINLLGVSIYLWNQEFMKDQLNRIKSKLHKNCKIVVGGPSVDVNINNNFFTQNAYADYAVYGPGETAIAELITHLVAGKKLSLLNVSNLAWYDYTKNKQVVSGYKNVPQSQISPFLHNQQFFSEIVNTEVGKNYEIILPYELTRGCPYSCTFCDWNSGLSTKVSRRKNSYKDEIDLFQNLGIKNLYFSDANFGQYDEDIDIVKYLVYKNLHENTDFKTDGNLSKLRKDNNLKIYHLFAQGGLVAKGWGFTFSVQDINRQVLDNIKRPDVGWDVHKKMITELADCYPEYLSKVQFIVGLPGQNFETVKESLLEIISVNKNILLSPFLNELLPASDASLDLEYQKKFNYIYSDGERINDFGFSFRGNFPKSCYSFSQEEFVKMIVLTSFFCGFAHFRAELNYTNFMSSTNLNIIIEYFIKSKYFALMTKNLYNNWVNDNKFFYTIDFDLKPKNVSACHIGETGVLWKDSINFKKILFESKLLNVEKNVMFNKMKETQTFEPWFAER